MSAEDADDPRPYELGRTLERAWRVERCTSLLRYVRGFGAAILQARGLPGDVQRHCMEIRTRSASVALIVLAPHAELPDRLDALAAGADEYLVFSELSTREMDTRIRLAAAKKAIRAEAPQLSFGIFVVDLSRPMLSVNSRTEELPVQQWQLVKRLVQAMGVPVAADVLCEFAGIQASPNHANLQNAMARLRRRLNGFSDRIATVKGVGYRIVP